jgi:uncharacterized tellurite resistance protein B-like protein
MSLVHLAYLLVNTDGQVDGREVRILKHIVDEEGLSSSITKDLFRGFKNNSHRRIFDEGIYYLNQCLDKEKLRALAILWRLIEADRTVHHKETLFFQHGLLMTGIKFDDVTAVIQPAGNRKSISRFSSLVKKVMAFIRTETF